MRTRRRVGTRYHINGNRPSSVSALSASISRHDRWHEWQIDDVRLHRSRPEWRWRSVITRRRSVEDLEALAARLATQSWAADTEPNSWVWRDDRAQDTCRIRSADRPADYTPRINYVDYDRK